MIHLLFAVRYQSQLRRVRPQMMSTLESEVVRAIHESGGIIRVDGPVLRATFNDDTLAFWLDLLVALEGIADAFAKASSDLFGSACVVYPDSSAAVMNQQLLRELSQRECPTGIWIDEIVVPGIAPYVDLGTAARFPADAETAVLCPLSSFKPVADPSGRDAGEDPDGEWPPILPGAESGAPPTCAAYVGEASRDWRILLRAYAGERCGPIPPYIARFGAGGTGFACLADAITPEIAQTVAARLNLSEGAAGFELLRSISAERLRAEPPAALVSAFIRLFASFADAYVSAARVRSASPLFVFEDVHKADSAVAETVSTILGRLVSANSAALIITAPTEHSTRAWTACALRPHVIPLTRRGFDARSAGDLPDDLVEYAYALSLLCPLFPSKDLRSLFALEGKPARALDHALAVLAAAGWIESPDNPAIASAEGPGAIESRLGPKAERVRALVRRRLLDAVATDKTRPSFGLLAALSSLQGECDDDLALDAVEAESGDGTIPDLERVLSSERLRAVLRKRTASLKYIALARCALRLSDERSVRTVFAAPLPDWFPSSRTRALALEALAAFSFGTSDIPGAEARAKESILLLQGGNDPIGLSRAYRLLGLVELAKERVSEAIDYFSFAQEGAVGEEAAVDAAYASVAEFIWGNTSKAERFALSAESLAARAYRTDWERWARFFRGRMRFEAGCYRDAAELFDSLISGGEDGPAEDERRTVAAWAFRARVYNSVLPPSAEGSVTEEGDGGLFLLESLFFSKDYRASIELADTLLSSAEPERFVSPERPDWRSGFSLAEDLVLPPSTTRRRLIRTLRALSLAASGKNQNAAAEAVEALRGLVKDEKLSESDPYDALYYRAYCQALEAASSPVVDVGTALSVAFKRVQRRASRIDDAEAKRSYLYLNRWNAALLADAKAHNLL